MTTGFRNDVFDALLALGAGLTWGSPTLTWKMTKRRVLTFADIGDAQPALCQAEYGEETQQRTGMPPIRTWNAAWFIYHYDGDPDSEPTRMSSDILDAVDRLFNPDILGGQQTLGDRVHKCWIDGATEKFSGNIDAQSLLVVPIKIMVP